MGYKKRFLNHPNIYLWHQEENLLEIQHWV